MELIDLIVWVKHHPHCEIGYIDFENSVFGFSHNGRNLAVRTEDHTSRISCTDDRNVVSYTPIEVYEHPGLILMRQ